MSNEKPKKNSLLIPAVLIFCCTPFLMGDSCGNNSNVCSSDSECDDGLFCNGIETCKPDNPMSSLFGCLTGLPCAGDCDEQHDVCSDEHCHWNSDCDDGLFCNGLERCSWMDSRADSRGCITDAEEFSCPYPLDVCDEDRQRCACPDWLGELDQDRDSYDTMEYACSTDGKDCDDNDRDRYPGHPEICLNSHFLDPTHDEDCNPHTFGKLDLDGDGFHDSRCCNTDEATGETFCGKDCNDADIAINPMQNELCNDIDDNCNGEIDEGLKIMAWYDGDGDGYGEPGKHQLVCPNTPNYALQAGDCDDTNPQIWPGSITCLKIGVGNEYNYCEEDGTWSPGKCPGQTHCLQQAGDYGICAL